MLTTANHFAPSTGQVINDPTDYVYYLRQLHIHKLAIDGIGQDIDAILIQNRFYRLRHWFTLFRLKRVQARHIRAAVELYGRLVVFHDIHQARRPLPYLPAEWFAYAYVL